VKEPVDQTREEGLLPRGETAAIFAWTDAYGLSFGGDAQAPVGASSSPSLRATSVSASLAVHTLVVIAAALWLSTPSGLIEKPSEAISVEMLQTPMIEQHEIEEMSEVVEVPAPSIAAGTPNGSNEPDALEAVDSAPQTLAPAVPEREGMEALKGSETVEEAIGSERRDVAEQREELRKDVETSPPDETPNKTTDRTQKVSKTKKGVSPQDDSAGAKAKAAPVSASTGSVLNYASRVRAKVSGHVPRSGAGKGTVVISFAVTKSGGLSGARISRSSGNAAVDKAALSGVRASAPFPLPPPGASPAQLRFSVAFQFR
jgi:protein TonB